MKNKTLSNLLLISITSIILLAFFENSLDPDDARAMYGITGIAIMVFGIWAAVRLRTPGKKK